MGSLWYGFCSEFNGDICLSSLEHRQGGSAGTVVQASLLG
jgi:hypothetical protein